jgi:hypothetical protein
MVKKAAPLSKELLQKRRQDQAKKTCLAKADAKLAGLSSEARGIHDAREAIKVATRDKRSEEGRQQLKARRDEYTRMLDDARREQVVRKNAACAQARKAAVDVLAESGQKAAGADSKLPTEPPSKQKRTQLTTDSTHATATARAVEAVESGRLTVAPSVHELRADERYRHFEAHLPTIEGLSAMANASVVYADTLMGIGSWGDEAGSWAQPNRWMPVIEKLNRAYNGLSPESVDMRALGMRVCNGEYNAVFFPGDEAQIELPPFVDGSGRVLRNDEVVLRMTRPDAAVQVNGEPFFRYKKLEALQKEFYYTLHGAVHGFAPACLAATLFPAIRVTAADGKVHDLYGTLYVMRKAQKDLNDLLHEQTALLRKKHLGLPGQTCNQSHTEALRKVGHQAALWLLPVLCQQAKVGALSFDAKPGNYVVGTDAKPYAIDFDAAMYTVTEDSSEQWPAALLLMLALLTSHMRFYSSPALTEGWVSALRPLILELCAPARAARWMFKARLCNRAFEETRGEDEQAAQMRFEMMVHTYFVKASSVSGAPFHARKGPNAPNLIEQLLRYCLVGSTANRDIELASALGCASAHSALHATNATAAAVGNVGNRGRSWG